MGDKLIRLAVLVFFYVFACAAIAQEPATTTTTTTTAPAVITEVDSHETRERLRQILHKLPPEVGKVLKLDPALWHNQNYLNNYPALAAFVAQHPEVAHSSRFYLEEIWIPSDPIPETAGVRMWRDVMEGLLIMTMTITFVFVGTWLIRTVIEQRRWSRLARVQADVHNKLLDRFSSNDDVMNYIKTPAGQKFLQAAPIPIEAGPRAISAPVSRVLWAVQAGLVLIAAGIGLLFVSWNVDKEVAQGVFSFGVLAMAVGAGFVVSAAASVMVARRLGVWEPPAQPAAETSE